MTALKTSSLASNSEDTSAQELRLPTLEELAGVPRLPKLPTLEEMVVHERGEKLHPLMVTSSPPPPPKSLFDSLLGGQLEALLQDARSNPQYYDREDLELLEQLAAGVKKLEALTPLESAWLDRATIQFSSFRPPRVPKSAPRPPAPKPVAKKEQEPQGGSATMEELAALSPDGLPPFWWL